MIPSHNWGRFDAVRAGVAIGRFPHRSVGQLLSLEHSIDVASRKCRVSPAYYGGYYRGIGVRRVGYRSVGWRHGRIGVGRIRRRR